MADIIELMNDLALTPVVRSVRGNVLTFDPAAWSVGVELAIKDFYDAESALMAEATQAQIDAAAIDDPERRDDIRALLETADQKTREARKLLLDIVERLMGPANPEYTRERWANTFDIAAFGAILRFFVLAATGRVQAVPAAAATETKRRTSSTLTIPQTPPRRQRRATRAA